MNVGERAGVTSSAAVAAPVIKSTKRAVPPERVVHWKEVCCCLVFFLFWRANAVDNVAPVCDCVCVQERHQLQEKSAHAATQKIFDKLVKLARKQGE